MDNQLTIGEEKSIQLQILDYVDAICRENKIDYWLDSGTLLGAIKYNGYIPWDDDIDLAVKRKDYDRLLKLLTEAGSRFQPLSMYNDDDYYYPYAKVIDIDTCLIEDGTKEIPRLGVYIDIFPLDYLPRDPKKRNRIISKVFKFRAISYFATFTKDQLKNSNSKDKIKCLFCRCFGWKRALRIVDSICRGCTLKYNDYIAELVTCYENFQGVLAEDFEKTIYHEFEGRRYPVPIGYNDYLTALYGDYSRLPPEEQRVSNHRYKAYNR